MGEWLLSRRDTLIVARQELPGSMQRVHVPEGRSKSWSVPNGASVSPNRRRRRRRHSRGATT
jgi:hypothetical protein